MNRNVTHLMRQNMKQLIKRNVLLPMKQNVVTPIGLSTKRNAMKRMRTNAQPAMKHLINKNVQPVIKKSAGK